VRSKPAPQDCKSGMLTTTVLITLLIIIIIIITFKNTSMYLLTSVYLMSSEGVRVTRVRILHHHRNSGMLWPRLVLARPHSTLGGRSGFPPHRTPSRRGRRRNRRLDVNITARWRWQRRTDDVTASSAVEERPVRVRLPRMTHDLDRGRLRTRFGVGSELDL